MKSLQERLEKLIGGAANHWIALTAFIGIMIGTAARFFWLSYPVKQVFDEVYFPVFAKAFLDGETRFDVHPPLGKFIIAVGIWVFGDNGFGWRIMPLLGGLALIGFVGWAAALIAKSRLAGLLAALFLAIDGAFIAYSRTGLMDGLLVLAIIACVVAIQKNKGNFPMFGVATLIGLTASIKWVGLAVIVPVAYIAWRKGKLAELLFMLWWSLAVYIVVVMAGQWIGGSTNLLQDTWTWHLQALNYQLTLNATHPYSSEWYTWPLMTRPVLFLYDVASDKSVQIMTTLGNPLMWWSSTVAVIGSVGHLVWLKMQKVKIADHPLVVPLLGWGACFLPWMLVHRVVFLYHYLPAYSFALIILAYWWSRFYRSEKWIAIGLLVLLIAITVFFLPFAVGWWPLSPEAIKMHVWFNSWIY